MKKYIPYVVISLVVAATVFGVSWFTRRVLPLVDQQTALTLSGLLAGAVVVHALIFAIDQYRQEKTGQRIPSRIKRLILSAVYATSIGLGIFLIKSPTPGFEKFIRVVLRGTVLLYLGVVITLRRRR